MGWGWLRRLFGNSGDALHLQVDGVDSFEDAMGYAHQAGCDVVFDFGDGDVLRLENTRLAELDSDRFTFV